MNYNVEVWKPVSGFEEEYLISNFGRLKSIKSEEPIILKLYIEKHGYVKSVLTKMEHGKNIKQRSARIHRLVAETFIPNPNGYKYVNHKDLNKQNNRVDNLEWCTASQNVVHAILNGTGIIAGVNKFNKNKSFIKYGYIYQFDKQMKFIGKYKDSQEAYKKTGVCARNILNCINHEPKRKTAGGFIWLKESEVVLDELRDIS